MKYKGVLARLQSYKPPADWAASVFLLPEPVNVKVLLEYAGVDAGRVDVVVDRLGYNWYLADLI